MSKLAWMGLVMLLALRSSCTLDPPVALETAAAFDASLFYEGDYDPESITTQNFTTYRPLDGSIWGDGDLATVAGAGALGPQGAGSIGAAGMFWGPDTPPNVGVAINHLKVYGFAVMKNNSEDGLTRIQPTNMRIRLTGMTGGRGWGIDWIDVVGTPVIPARANAGDALTYLRIESDPITVRPAGDTAAPPHEQDPETVHVPWEWSELQNISASFYWDYPALGGTEISEVLFREIWIDVHGAVAGSVNDSIQIRTDAGWPWGRAKPLSDPSGERIVGGISKTVQIKSLK